MSLKKLIYALIALIVVFLLLVNSSILANQAVDWVKEHPNDPNAPEVLYRAGRWCDVLGDNNKATEIYALLYAQYPDKGEFCAPAMYYTAVIKNNESYNVGVRKQALPYLQIVMNQYSSQVEWTSKAKQLYDEVNYVH